MSFEEIDYNSYLKKISYSLYNNISNLKICLESAAAANNIHNNNNINNNSNNLLIQEMKNEQIEKLKYSILEDLETISNNINNTYLLPDYTIQLIVSPKHSKENFDSILWR